MYTCCLCPQFLRLHGYQLTHLQHNGVRSGRCSGLRSRDSGSIPNNGGHVISNLVVVRHSSGQGPCETKPEVHCVIAHPKCSLNIPLCHFAKSSLLRRKPARKTRLLPKIASQRDYEHFIICVQTDNTTTTPQPQP